MSDIFTTGYDTIREEAEKSGNFTPEFRMADGEQAKVRFLTEEPIGFRQHSFQVPIDGQKYPKFTCRGKDCPLCTVLHDNPRFVGAWTIWDYRDRGSVKVYVPGIRVLRVLDKHHMMEGGLSGKDFVILRTGKKFDTSYQFMPQPPTPVPPEAMENGVPKTLNIRELYAAKSHEELLDVAYRLSKGGEPPQETQPFGMGSDSTETDPNKPDF